MTESKEPREVLLKKKSKPSISSDYDAINAHPEHLCDQKDLEAERILGYIRYVEESAYDALKAENEKFEKMIHLGISFQDLIDDNKYGEGMKNYPSYVELQSELERRTKDVNAAFGFQTKLKQRLAECEKALSNFEEYFKAIRDGEYPDDRPRLKSVEEVLLMISEKYFKKWGER